MFDGLWRHIERDVKYGHRQRRHQGYWLGIRVVRILWDVHLPRPNFYCSTCGLIVRDFPEMTQPPDELEHGAVPQTS